MTTDFPNTKVVGFPLFDKVTLLDFAGATQIFADAEGFTPVWLAPEMRPYQTSEKTVNITEKKEEEEQQQPICIQPQFTFSDPNRPRIDILFCPGGASGSYDDNSGEGNGFIGAMFDETYQDFVTEVANEEAYCYGSVCTGAFVLAAAGLLDGCTATTYWSVIEELRRFPNITVPEGYPRVLINTEVGGEKKVCFSGGGVSSSLDLALALVNHLSNDDPLVAQKAQLKSQYSPNPIINFGDPSEASQGMVEESEFVKDVRQSQNSGFIYPTQCAVTKILNQGEVSKKRRGRNNKQTRGRGDAGTRRR
ncbi:MAG: hypothetical protein F6J92_28895 [Symploca sp. SIO1A3]|nr:hypothetical protein [Symploca sp. SIO1A3]